MPEGPEIRIAADRIAKVLEGRVLESVTLTLPRLQRFESRLVGETVTSIDTRGKAMLTRFSNGMTLYSHNQLYGRWYTTHRPRIPDTKRQLRVALHTQTHSALLYSASDIEILSERQLSRHPFLQRLGPDILDRALTSERILERLVDPSFSGRALGALYLDQGFLAGNGNYLRSEILWSARVNPAARPCDLNDRHLYRVASETLRIARRSYRTGGVTVPDTIARELRAGGQGYESYRFQVYGREGLPCRQCGSEIERGSIGSRSIFTCPGCQPV
jgi:endonuclease-8